MATMALRQPRFFRSTLPGVEPAPRGGPETTHIKETASQTYEVGDLVHKDSNGTIAICTTSSDKLNSAIAGSATKAATGTTGAQAFYRAIRPDDIWLMNVFHGTPASSVTALTQNGGIYGIFFTSDTWVVDIENTTVEDASVALARVQVVGFPTGGWFPNSSGTYVQSAIGDTNGLVLVKFLEFSIGSDGDPRVRVLQDA
jgi:hypothetical protein